MSEMCRCVCKFCQKKVLQSIGVGVGTFLGVPRIFALISPNLPYKSFCVTFDCKFPPSKIMKIFWYDLQKKVFICFSANVWASFREIKHRWAPFLPGFLEILPKFPGTLPAFSTTFGSALAPPAPLPPTPVLQRKLSLGWCSYTRSSIKPKLISK